MLQKMPLSFKKKKEKRKKKQNKIKDAFKLCLSDKHNLYKEYIIIKCCLKFLSKDSKKI